MVYQVLSSVRMGVTQLLRKIVLTLALMSILFFGTGLSVAAQNLLVDNGFEQVGERGSGAWLVDYWRSDAAIGITDSTARSGKYSAVLQSPRENDVRLIQTVAVEPDTVYRFSGWIKTGFIPGNKAGASLCVMGGYIHSQPITGKRHWQQAELFFRTRPNQTTVTLGVRLGFYNNTIPGLAYFDDLKLEKATGKPTACQTLDDASINFRMTNTLQPARLIKISPGTDWGLVLKYYCGWLFNYEFVTVLFYLAVLAVLAIPVNKSGDKILQFNTLNRFRARLPFYFGGAALGAILARLLLLPSAPFPSDMACFAAWASRIVETGPGGFYVPGYFCDYPPFALYILWVVGILVKFLNVATNSVYFNSLFKIPGILCDLGTAWLILLFLKRKNPVLGLFLSGVYLFLPPIIYNSAFWGQVDCYYAFMVLGAFYLLVVKGQPELAAAAAMASLLTKTQTIAFLPLLFICLFLNFNWKRVLQTIGTAIITFVLVVLPFNVLTNFNWFWDFYIRQAENYPYASVNAANFLNLLNGNFVSDSVRILPGISYKLLGTVLFAFFVIWSGYFYWRKRTRGSLMAAATVISFAFFIFFPRMHERYLFPVLAFFLLAVGYYKDKKLYFLALVASIGYLLNLHYVILLNHGKLTKESFNQLMYGLSWVNTGTFICLCILLQGKLSKKKVFRRLFRKLNNKNGSEPFESQPLE